MKKYLLIVLALLTLACGQTMTALPTAAAVNNAEVIDSAEVVENTPQNATETPQKTQETPQPDILIVSADILRVRACASTSCREIASVTLGQELTSAGVTMEDISGSDTADCPFWTGVIYDGRTAWVCDAFVYHK